MDESVVFAKKYLEDILSFFDLNTDIEVSHDNEVIELKVPSTPLNGFLIGQRGDTLRAIQFLISTALKNNDYEYARVNVDIAGYKKQKAERLTEEVKVWVEEFKASGEESKELQSMNAVDRRTVHQAIGEIEGVSTQSKGEGRERRVVLISA